MPARPTPHGPEERGTLGRKSIDNAASNTDPNGTKQAHESLLAAGVALAFCRIGWFSSDRTVQEYARDIWGIKPVL
jgi:glucan phosphorylase